MVVYEEGLKLRDLLKDLTWLQSIANSPDREHCPDTIHEVAIANTEQAVKAEAKLTQTEMALAKTVRHFSDKLEKAEALNKKLDDALEVALDNYDDWADGKLDTMTECMSVLAEARMG